MKAKEYAKNFINKHRETENLGDPIYAVIRLFMIEMGDLITQRNVVSDEACFSVIKELNDKYRAFTVKVNESFEKMKREKGLDSRGFLMAFATHSNSIYQEFVKAHPQLKLSNENERIALRMFNEKESRKVK